MTFGCRLAVCTQAVLELCSELRRQWHKFDLSSADQLTYEELCLFDNSYLYVYIQLFSIQRTAWDDAESCMPLRVGIMGRCVTESRSCL